jgi:hypothetical protein
MIQERECKRGERIDDQRKATREVIAGTAIEPYPPVALAGDDVETVVLDLVQPLAARGQLVGFGWEARRDEPGREGALQHGGLDKATQWLSQLHQSKLAFFARITSVTTRP